MCNAAGNLRVTFLVTRSFPETGFAAIAFVKGNILNMLPSSLVLQVGIHEAAVFSYPSNYAVGGCRMIVSLIYEAGDRHNPA